MENLKLGNSTFAACGYLSKAFLPAGQTKNDQGSAVGTTFADAYSLGYVGIPRDWMKTEFAFNPSIFCPIIAIPPSVTAFSTTSPMSRYNTKTVPLILIPGSITSYSGIAHVVNSNGTYKIVVLATTPPALASSSAMGDTTKVVIYVPDDAVTTYQSATNWSGYTIRSTTTLISELQGGT